MAKWGEGDPRWIVENRDDGKNVNQWHWSEINRLAWSKQRLAELLPGLEATVPAADSGSDGGDGGDAWCARVTEVKDISGEAMLTTRKGNKRFAFYDLKMTLAWEAAPLPPPPAGPAAAGEAADGAAGEEAAAAEGTAGEEQEAAAAATAAAAAATGAAAAAMGNCSLEVAAAAVIDSVPADEVAAAADINACASSGAEEEAAPMAVPAAASEEAAPPAVASEGVKGEITVAEFTSGTDHDDIEMAVTVSGGNSEAERQLLKRHAESALWLLVLQQLERFVEELSQP